MTTHNLLITKAQLRRAADGGSWERGVGYHKQGRAELLFEDNGVIQRCQADLARHSSPVAAEEVKEAVGNRTLSDELDANTGIEDRRHHPVGLFENSIKGLKRIARWTEVDRRRPLALARQFPRDSLSGAAINEDHVLARVV
ncbi:MAG: hypothetical protein FJ279_16145 [Planctomycetes bacterium]|nr:hypothetical protein [Planctomycetota bacterium]